MYAPAILFATEHRYYEFGQYVGVLYTDIIAAGKIRYRYMFAIRSKESQSIFLHITSELNTTYGLFGRGVAGEGTHFLCMFRDSLHHNFGDSNDWADIEKFEARAMAIAAEQVNFPVKSVRRLGNVDPDSAIARLMENTSLRTDVV